MSEGRDDTLDRQLHDLLDDRLGAEDRRRLEARLHEDPDLAARLEAFREIGEALREDDAGLPAGFHARARARFESAQPAGRRWFRPLSWESLGVVAAAVLAMAVFVPQWVGDGSPLGTDRPRMEAEQKAVAAEAAPPPPPQAMGKAASAPDVVRQANPPARARAASPPPAGQSPQQPPARTVEDEDGFAPAAPSGADRAAGEAAGAAVAQKREISAVVADAPGTTAPGATAETRREDQRAEEGLRSVADEEAFTQRFQALKSAPKTEASPANVPVALLEDGLEEEAFAARAMRRPLVGKGQVLIVDDLETLRRWERMAADRGDAVASRALSVEPSGRETSAEEPDAEAKKLAQPEAATAPVRWVLIGPRERPFACAGLQIAAKADAWVIGLSPPSTEHPAAPHGCALALPRDGRDVRVKGP